MIKSVKINLNMESSVFTGNRPLWGFVDKAIIMV